MQGIQQSGQTSSASAPRETADAAQAERDVTERNVTENSVPDDPPCVSVKVSPDQSAILVRVAGGQSLELPVAVWRDALVLIDAIISRDAQTPLADAGQFGPAPGRVGPGRHGADWSVHEAALLTKSFREGSSIAALALAHQRTTGAVENQLVKLGVLRPAERQFGSPRRTTGHAPNFGEPR